ncbi:hypothetical protein [Bosea sp. NBC_00550]|uniref:hypothetical protein n=1 Tax=Bosea sp. NBC_00550 TaxID=2969621 RepID=UPI00222E2E9F|nr:hypothetical protein [Bosea sp. NBC_00550]UZF90594.1 hypothetical protein NWE53_15750 [Bosea sp. NBC_00550]
MPSGTARAPVNGLRCFFEHLERAAVYGGPSFQQDGHAQHWDGPDRKAIDNHPPIVELSGDATPPDSAFCGRRARCTGCNRSSGFGLGRLFCQPERAQLGGPIPNRSLFDPQSFERAVRLDTTLRRKRCPALRSQLSFV